MSAGIRLVAIDLEGALLRPQGLAGVRIEAQQIEAAYCLQVEKQFLKEIGSRASEKRMKALLRLESLI